MTKLTCCETLQSGHQEFQYPSHTIDICYQTGSDKRSADIYSC